VFAVPSPHDIGPIEIAKVARITAALDADSSSFTACSMPTLRIQAGLPQAYPPIGFESQRGLERVAERFRAGAHVRTSVRWDYPLYERIRPSDLAPPTSFALRPIEPPHTCWHLLYRVFGKSALRLSARHLLRFCSMEWSCCSTR
jgi:hypothetical protein